MSAPGSPARLSVQGLSKSFSGVQVLHDVSFEALAGCVLGIVGENGCGKSTTMNLLTGVVSRDQGQVLLDGKPFNPASRRESDLAGIAFIQQELTIFANLSVAENLFLNHLAPARAGLPLISKAKLRARAQEVLRRVELDVAPNMLAGKLSAGERQLLEIARGLATQASVFIFDEPGSSLTARELERLFDIIRRIKAQQAAVLYISHHLQEVLELCDQVMVMRDGRVTLSAESRSLTPGQLVLSMVGRPIEALFTPRAGPTADAPVALEVRGLGQPALFAGIDLQVRRGEIVGIAGLMGSGRSEVARAIFGLDPYRSGVVRVSGQTLPAANLPSRLRAGVAFVTEDRRQEGLMLDAGVADNMALAVLPRFASRWLQRVDRTRLMGLIRRWIEQLRVKCNDIDAPVRALSGGNQQKVVLGRWLLREPQVLILDEPTRGVDIGAKQEIYQLLAQMAQAGTAVLLISSELEELIGLCDRIHVMRHGELRAEFSREQFDRERLLRVAFGQEAAA